MSNRDDDLNDRLSSYLDRRSPPQRIAKNPAAMAAEFRDLLAVVLRQAPGRDIEAWWDGMERHLAENAKTRAWPTVAEIVDAAKATRTMGGGFARSEGDSDEAAIQSLVSWLEKHGDQRTGMGRPDRTKRLVAMGHLADMREARFRGFDMTDEDARAARDLRPGRAEWDHHVATMARIRNIEDRREAEDYCIRASSGSQLPEHLAYLDKGQSPAPITEPRQGFRRMADAIARERVPADHLIEPVAPQTAEEIAARPYTDEERARMAMLRGREDEGLRA